MVTQYKDAIISNEDTLWLCLSLPEIITDSYTGEVQFMTKKIVMQKHCSQYGWVPIAHA